MKIILGLVCACACLLSLDAVAATSTASTSTSASGSFSYSTNATASSSGTSTQAFTLAPGGTVYSQQYPRAYANYPYLRYYQNGSRYNGGYSAYRSAYAPSQLATSFGFYPRVNRNDYRNYHSCYRHH